ncbi:glycosyltransferase [Bacteroidota bacterium]
MDLSIIIPVYNEADKIARDISEADDFLNRNGLTGEIIIVDDGSWDDTVQNAKGIASVIKSPLQVIEYIHKGKGRMVKTGILQAISDIVMFIDSGSCVPYDNILPGLDLLRNDEYDILHGSRLLDGSKINGKTRSRKIISWLFRRSISGWMRIPKYLTDTQCGLKIYKREVAHTIYRGCITNGFIFDIEIILRADKAGYRIKEFPIEWTADPDSRLSIMKNFWQIIRELKKIKKELK